MISKEEVIHVDNKRMSVIKNDEVVASDSKNESTAGEVVRLRTGMIEPTSVKRSPGKFLTKRLSQTSYDMANNGNLSKFLRNFGLNRSPSSAKIDPGDVTNGHSSDTNNNNNKTNPAKLFGKDLSVHLKETRRKVPFIIKVCTECIENHGIIDGIYRLSGISSSVRALKMSFEKACEEESKVILNPRDPGVRQDIHSISSLVKQYCRELPESLTTFALYNDFINAVKLAEHDKLGAIRNVVQRLPEDNFRTLSFLMRHLHFLSEKSSETGMTAKNLAIVWAPNLLKHPEDKYNAAFSPLTKAHSSSALLMSPTKMNRSENLRDIAAQAACTEYLIRYWHVLFTRDLPQKTIPEVSSGEKEVDIDKAIAKAAAVDGRASSEKPKRPRSIAVLSPVENDLEDVVDDIDVEDFFVRRLRQMDRLGRRRARIRPALIKESSNELDPIVPNLERSKSSVAVTMSETSTTPISTTSSSFQQHFNKFFHNDKAKKADEESKEDSEERPRRRRKISTRKSLSELTFRQVHRQTEPEPKSRPESLVENPAKRARPLRSALSSDCVKRRVQNRVIANLNISSSSEENEDRPHNEIDDVITEVNNLHLSFDLEEKEMQMMNCKDDDDDDDDDDEELTGLDSTVNISHTKGFPIDRAMNLKVNMKFLTKGGQQPQQQTSSMMALKHRVTSVFGGNSANKTKNVYKCGTNEQLSKETTVNKASSKTGAFVDLNHVRNRMRKQMRNNGNPDDDGSETKIADSDSDSLTAHDVLPHHTWDLRNKNKVAFSNPSYQLVSNHQQDSGFESASEQTIKASYENVDPNAVSVREKTLSKDAELFLKSSHGCDEDYENIDLEELRRLEIVPDDESPVYQNVDMKHSRLFEIVDNHRTPTSSNTLSESYQNVDFATSTRSQSRRPQAAIKKPPRKNDLNAPFPEYSVVDKSAKKGRCASAGDDVYENFEFGEDSVYQSLVFKNGHAEPESITNERVERQISSENQMKVHQTRTKNAEDSNNDDVYRQVSFLRQSVQEVNSLLSTTNLVVVSSPEKPSIKNARSFERDRKTIEARRAKFKALVSKFEPDDERAKTNGTMMKSSSLTKKVPEESPRKKIS